MSVIQKGRREITLLTTNVGFSFLLFVFDFI